MTNKQREESFKRSIEAWCANKDDHRTQLEVTMAWIKKNLSPDEVFRRDELKHWCKENEGYLENKYPVTENY